MSHLVRPLLLLTALLVACGVQAQTTGDPQVTTQAQASKPKRDQSLPATVRRVERETGGEVISAEPVRRGGREVYNLKVLTPNGRVKVVQDDPQDQERDSAREYRSDPASQRDQRPQERRQRESRREQRNEPDPRDRGSSSDDDNSYSQP